MMNKDKEGKRIKARMSGRIPVIIPVDFSCGETRRKGVIIDLGGGGVKILTSGPLEQGNNFSMNFSLGEQVSCEGEVISLNAEKIEGYGQRTIMGVSFIKLSDEEKRKIQDYIYDYRYYTSQFRPTQEADFIRSQNLKKAVALLDHIE